MSTIRDAIYSMDENGLWAMVACAIAVGIADGRFDPNERNELIQNLRTVGCDRGASMEVINSVLQNINGMGPNDVIDWASEYIADDSVAAACFVIASAIAAKAGGIGYKEGVVLQYLANTVGIGYPGDYYMQLLGEGMQLARG
ncbi:MAG: hypothetical protein MUF64_33180 [Polyangiaceae bacterium]|jgi:tellurite resistance protein|nr:hypothetical protein [Polyangiaceae bacterium]